MHSAACPPTSRVDLHVLPCMRTRQVPLADQSWYSSTFASLFNALSPDYSLKVSHHPSAAASGLNPVLELQRMADAAPERRHVRHRRCRQGWCMGCVRAGAGSDGPAAAGDCRSAHRGTVVSLGMPSVHVPLPDTSAATPNRSNANPYGSCTPAPFRPPPPPKHACLARPPASGPLTSRPRVTDAARPT